MSTIDDIRSTFCMKFYQRLDFRKKEKKKKPSFAISVIIYDKFVQ